MLMTLCEGLLMIECKQIYMNGAREHFRQYYNFMDFSILALYMASYALRFATYYRVTEASLYFNPCDRGKPLLQPSCQRQASISTFVTEASLYFNATTRIERAVEDCDLKQLKKLIRETTEQRHDQYGYFMAARTLPYHTKMY